MKINANTGYYDFDRNELWTIICDMYTLVCIKDQKIEFMYVMEEPLQIRDIVSYNDKIYYFAQNKPCMWLVDKSTKNVQYITYTSNVKFPISNAVAYKDCIYIFGAAGIDMILCLNLDNGEKELYPMPFVIGKESITRISMWQNKICFCSRKENEGYIFILDCDSKKIDYAKLDDERFVQCQVADDDGIYILYKDKYGNSTIEKRNYYLRKEWCQRFRNIDVGESEKLVYFRMLKKYNSLFLIRTEGVGVERVNIDKDKTECISVEYPIASSRGKVKNKFYEAIDCGEQILLFSVNSDCIFKMKYEENEMDIYNISSEKINKKVIAKDIITKNGVIAENSNISLTLFLDGI